MTAFELYLILKLDDLQLVIGWVFGFSALGWAGCCLVSGLHYLDHDEGLPKMKRGARRFLATAVIAMAAALVVPSTKQVAAIYVLSALTQEQTLDTVQKESGELYGLFKAWLRSEIGEDAPENEEAADG